MDNDSLQHRLSGMSVDVQEHIRLFAEAAEQLARPGYRQRMDEEELGAIVAFIDDFKEAVTYFTTNSGSPSEAMLYVHRHVIREAATFSVDDPQQLFSDLRTKISIGAPITRQEKEYLTMLSQAYERVHRISLR